MKIILPIFCKHTLIGFPLMILWQKIMIKKKNIFWSI